MNYPAASPPQAGKQRGIEQQTDDRPKGRGTCPSGSRVKPLPASGGIKDFLLSHRAVFSHLDP